jgi:hypothetical protein
MIVADQLPEMTFLFLCYPQSLFVFATRVETVDSDSLFVFATSCFAIYRWFLFLHRFRLHRHLSLYRQNYFLILISYLHANCHHLYYFHYHLLHFFCHHFSVDHWQIDSEHHVCQILCYSLILHVNVVFLGFDHVHRQNHRRQKTVEHALNDVRRHRVVVTHQELLKL